MLFFLWRVIGKYSDFRFPIGADLKFDADSQVASWSRLLLTILHSLQFPRLRSGDVGWREYPKLCLIGSS